jgi:hypothetical protein
MSRALSLLLLLASTARADFFNSRNLILGERASLLGGAFTALADDATAGYYNPAGLVQAPGFTVTASADIYALYLPNRTELVNDDGARLSLGFVRTVILPTTFALSYQVHPRVTLAVHVFSPDRFRLSAINSIDAPVVARALGSEQVFDGLSRSARFDQSSALYGVSAGFVVTDWFSAGVSLHYHLTQTSQALASTYFTHASEDGSVAAQQATVLADNEVTAGGFIPQVGVLFRLPHGLRIGANWQCETLTFHGENAWQVSLSSSALGQSFASGTTRGDSRYPHRFSLGRLAPAAHAPISLHSARSPFPNNRSATTFTSMNAVNGTHSCGSTWRSSSSRVSGASAVSTRCAASSPCTSCT